MRSTRAAAWFLWRRDGPPGRRHTRPRQIARLKRAVIGHRSLGQGDAMRWRLEVAKSGGGHLCHHSTPPSPPLRRFFQCHQPPGPGDGLKHHRLIPGPKRQQVDHLGIDRLRRLERGAQHGTASDRRYRPALSAQLAPPERQSEAAVQLPLIALAVKDAGFEHHHRVRVVDCRAQQGIGAARAAGHRQLEPRRAAHPVIEHLDALAAKALPRPRPAPPSAPWSALATDNALSLPESEAGRVPHR